MALGAHSLVVVIDRYGQGAFRVFLANHVFLQEIEDFMRSRQDVQPARGAAVEFFGNNVVAQLDALITDIHAGTGDELTNLTLGLSTERTLQQVDRFGSA